MRLSINVYMCVYNYDSSQKFKYCANTENRAMELLYY